jgi:carbonic anhydrase/acetyltransferase-like protein (isoleucine patch superfamily)
MNGFYKILNILNEPLLNNFNRLLMLKYKLIHAIFYKSSFKHMGKGSLIINPMLITNSHHIEIGDSVFIRSGARIETYVTNMCKTPELIIGDNTNIEQNVHIICHHKVHIGSNVSITGNCAIVDTTHPYEDVNDPMKIGARILDDDAFVEIGNGCFIGFGSMILPNVKIGEYVIIGANSVVTKDIPSYCVAMGNPAKVVKTYDADNKCWVSI